MREVERDQVALGATADKTLDVPGQWRTVRCCAPSCAVLCCVFCCACYAFCCAVLCSVHARTLVLHCIVLCCVLCCVVLCCVVLCCVVLCCVVLCCVVLCCVVLCCVVLCCVVLCCVVLCCVVLCCVALCSVVLCCKPGYRAQYFPRSIARGSFGRLIPFPQVLFCFENSGTRYLGTPKGLRSHTRRSGDVYCGPSPFAWRLNVYDDATFDPSPIRVGTAVQLYHKAIDGFLTADQPMDRVVALPRLDTTDAKSNDSNFSDEDDVYQTFRRTAAARSDRLSVWAHDFGRRSTAEMTSDGTAQGVSPSPTPKSALQSVASVRFVRDFTFGDSLAALDRVPTPNSQDSKVPFVCAPGHLFWSQSFPLSHFCFARTKVFVCARARVCVYRAGPIVQNCTFSFSINRPKDVSGCPAALGDFSFNRFSCFALVLRFPTCVWVCVGVHKQLQWCCGVCVCARAQVCVACGIPLFPCSH